MSSFTERAEQFQRRKTAEKLLDSSSSAREEATQDAERRSTQAECIFRSCGLGDFLDEGAFFLREGQHIADVRITYEISSSADHEWDHESPLDRLSRDVAVAEIRWGFEQADFQDGFSFVRIQLNLDGTICIMGLDNVHQMSLGSKRASSERDDVEFTIVDAFFNPGYRTPLSGIHPENQ